MDPKTKIYPSFSLPARLAIVLPFWAAAGLALSGCATRVGQMRQEAVDWAYTSDKPPHEIAACMQRVFPRLSIDLGPDYYSVSSRNQYDSIIIELRRTNSIAPGVAAVEECF
jgi:hypothetical protein